jgi:hypothetical protein
MYFKENLTFKFILNQITAPLDYGPLTHRCDTPEAATLQLYNSFLYIFTAMNKVDHNTRRWENSKTQS